MTTLSQKRATSLAICTPYRKSTRSTAAYENSPKQPPLVADESLSDALIDIIGYASLLYERLNPVVMRGNWLFRNKIFEIDPVTEDIKYTDGRLVIRAESVKAMCMNPTLTTEVYVMEQSEVEPFEAALRSLVMRHGCEYDFPNLRINVCNNGAAET